MADAKNRTDGVTMETGPLICPRCKKPISPFVVEEIGGVTQLRAGKGLMIRAEISCLTPDCGCIFVWIFREKDLEKTIVMYEKILGSIQRYNPE